MGQKLAGKVAVITGGNSGIGLATARRFVEEGAYVFITGRRKAELDKAVAAIERNVTPFVGDVTKLDDLDRLYDLVKREKGRIDVLVANAGASEGAPLGTITEEHFDRLFGINVRGLVFTVQKALPLMTRGGSIVLTGSVAGMKGIEGLSVYSATKAAVRSLAQSWAMDLRERGIRVNVLSPGPIDTPMAAAASQEMMQQIMAQVPMRRFGAPSEVAGAMLFLASDDSSYVHGGELYVDGGAAQV